MEFIKYTAKVSGLIWNGGKGYTTYTFTHHPTRAEILARSGDFSQVTGIRLTKTTTRLETVKVAPAE